MTQKRASRLDTAISIRDAARNKVMNEGQLVDTEFGPLLEWTGDELSIAYSTPFLKLPPPDEDVLQECNAAGIAPPFNLPFCLDIWGTKGKVLNIEWDHENHVELVSFKRGKWEERVLQRI